MKCPKKCKVLRRLVEAGWAKIGVCPFAAPNSGYYCLSTNGAGYGYGPSKKCPEREIRILKRMVKYYSEAARISGNSRETEKEVRAIARRQAVKDVEGS